MLRLQIVTLPGTIPVPLGLRLAATGKLQLCFSLSLTFFSVFFISQRRVINRGCLRRSGRPDWGTL